MTIQEMHIAISVGVQSIASHTNRFLQPELIDTIINDQTIKFVRESFNTFESTVRNLELIKTLIVTDSLSSTGHSIEYDYYYDKFTFKPNHLFLIAQTSKSKIWTDQTELVQVIGIDDYTIRVGEGNFFNSRVVLQQLDDIESVLKNPFSSPDKKLFHCIVIGNNIHVFTGNGFCVDRLVIKYIRKPISVNFNTTTHSDLPDAAHDIIVDRVIKRIMSVWNKFGAEGFYKELTTT